MSDSRGDRPDRIWVGLALAFTAFWLGYLIVFGPKGDTGDRLPRLDPNGNFGQADYRWQVLDLDGKPVEFAQFKGKAVFLNLWATFCPPCRAEMPAIARLAANPRFQGKDVAFLCVSTDEDAGLVKAYVAGKGWPMTILRATTLPSVFLTDGIPATFLIAPDGRVVVSELGAAAWDRPEVAAFLESLANPNPNPKPKPKPKPKQAK